MSRTPRAVGSFTNSRKFARDRLQHREHQPAAARHGQQRPTGRTEPAAPHPEADPHHGCPFGRPRRRQPAAVELHAHRCREQRERHRETVQGGVPVARAQPPRDSRMQGDEGEADARHPGDGLSIEQLVDPEEEAETVQMQQQQVAVAEVILRPREAVHLREQVQREHGPERHERRRHPLA